MKSRLSPPEPPPEKATYAEPVQPMKSYVEALNVLVAVDQVSPSVELSVLPLSIKAKPVPFHTGHQGQM